MTQAGTIISGHRRQAGAIAAGCPLVPIVIEPEALDDLAIRRELIISNKQREKTVEQRTREFDELTGVEKELAKKRQASTGTAGRKKNGSDKKTQSDAGRATAIAAEAVGMSRSTAEKASEVVQAIDKAEAAGDKATASKLRNKLEKSVAGAHAVLKAETATDTPAGLDDAGATIPRRLEKAFAIRTTIDAVLNLLRQVKGELNKAVELPGGEILKDRSQSIEINLKNLRADWRFAKPFCVCPGCNASGKDCDACKKRGWIIEDSYERNFRKRDSQPICADQDSASRASQYT